MLYTELIQLWDEAVRAVDNRDWDGALAKLIQISEPTSRTLFVNASVHLALGQLEEAIKVRLLKIHTLSQEGNCSFVVGLYCN